MLPNKLLAGCDPGLAPNKPDPPEGFEADPKRPVAGAAEVVFGASWALLSIGLAPVA